MMLKTLPWLLVPALMVGAGTATRQSGPAPVVTTITDLSLSHLAGTATLNIAIDGPVTMQEEVLRQPDRIQLDFAGAALGPVASYDGLKRGHVVGVRAYQYQPNVVRLVLEFDELPTYTVKATDPGVVAVSFLNSDSRDWNVPAKPAQPNREPLFAPANQQQDLYSFTWIDMSYQDVVTALSIAGNRSIILGRGVKSVPVTMTLRNKTWAQAFNAFLESQKLSAKELDGGIIHVDDPTEMGKLDSLERLSVVQMSLNYASALSLVEPVKGMLSKSRGTVSADSATNSLIVTDTPSRIEDVRRIITGLDVKNRTIRIEAKMVFVDRTNLDRLGLQYDLADRNQFFNKLVQRPDPTTGKPYNPNINVVNLYGSSVAAVANADQVISNSALDLIFSTAIGGYSVTSFLSALRRVEMTDIEATPSINTVDNQEAVILSGEETPVRVIDLSSATGVGQPARATVSFKETGIKLTAKPHVTNNGQILLTLQAERSSVQPLTEVDLGYTIPKQSAVTTLMLNNGETGMVGGLVVSTITKNRSGIPLLSSLPFIGPLFSFSETSENRKDLIITVTPRILD